MKRIVAVGVAALAALTWIPAPARASVQTRVEHYTGGDAGPLVGGTAQCITKPSSGAVCFGHTDADAVQITVEDDSGRPVGGLIEIGAEGAGRTRYLFCGSSPRLSITHWRAYVNVYLDGTGDARQLHWFNGPGCAEVGGVATLGATSGRVRATFSDL